MTLRRKGLYIHLVRVVLFLPHHCAQQDRRRLSLRVDPVDREGLACTGLARTATLLRDWTRFHGLVRPFPPEEIGRQSVLSLPIVKNGPWKNGTHSAKTDAHFNPIPNDWTWMTAFAFRSHFTLQRASMRFSLAFVSQLFHTGNPAKPRSPYHKKKIVND